MNKRKNQNSVLVLATLGVYLGLVLTGATPQLLAQAATAKQFDIKDEIEKNEDLDSKLNDQTCDAAHAPLNRAGVELLETYIQGVSRSIESYADARSKGYNLSLKITSGRIFDEIVNPFTKVDRDIKMGFLHPRIDGDGVYVQLLLKGNSSEYWNSSLYSAVVLGSAIFKCRRTALNEKLLIKHTSVSSFNDQVLIVTHLPRAGLDSLLAKNGK